MVDPRRFHVLSGVDDIVGGHNGFTDAYKVLRSHRSPCSIIILGSGDQFPLALCNPPVHDIRLAVLLSGLRSIISFSPSLLFSPSLSSSSAFSSPFDFARCVSLTFPIKIIPPFSTDRLSSFLLFFLSFALARLSRLLSIACQHNAS